MCATVAACLGTRRCRLFNVRLTLAIVLSSGLLGGATSESQVVEVHARGNLHPDGQKHHAEVQQHSQSSFDEEPVFDLTDGHITDHWDRSKAEQEATSEIESGLMQLGSSDRLIRSENLASSQGQQPATAADALKAPNGVVQGACANFRKTGSQDVSVSCPTSLKMVGCSCRDKEGQNTGGCGTKFSAMETCNAFTKVMRSVTAYVRCCNIEGDTMSNFQILTSAASKEGDGEGVIQECPVGSDVIGCACLPADAPNFGCKHDQIQARGCLATNLKDHPKGVKAQALCAVIGGGKLSTWETVKLAEHVVDRSTNLSCSANHLHMISCSCGSSTGQCNGGKVLGNKCECFGARCFATARCGDIPIPPTNCHWNHWGEWTDCSASCGGGTQSRVREIAMIAMNGGLDCNGSNIEESGCKGDGSERECNATNITQVAEKPVSHTLLIIISVIFICGGGGAAGAKHHMDKQAGGEGEWGGEGEGEFGGGGGEWAGGGEGEWGGGGMGAPGGMMGAPGGMGAPGM